MLGALALVLAGAGCLTRPQPGAGPEPTAARGALQVGTDTFRFTGSAGSRERPVRVWYHRPPSWTPDDPVVFVMHGNGRNADDYHARWVPLAEQHGFLLVTPEFSAQYYASQVYHQGNILSDDGIPVDSASWTFVTIERIWEEVRLRSGSNRQRYRIYGHSAGSQFVHRMLWMMPAARIEHAIPANAGWYTMPSMEIDFPYGLGEVSDSTSFRRRATAAFGRRVTVLLGEADTSTTDDDLRRTPEAIRQGAYRLARGRNFFEAARRQADSLGVPFRWTLRTVPGVGHSNGGIAPAAADEFSR